MRRCITARRTGLNEIEEQRTKQLAEVRAWRDELAVAGSGLLVPAEEQAHWGRYLASADFSASSYATIYPSVASGRGRLAQTWKVLSLDNGEYVVEQKGGGTIRNEHDGLFGPTGLGAGPVPAPTAYTRPNPDTTPEVLIGTTILPQRADPEDGVPEHHRGHVRHQRPRGGIHHRHLGHRRDHELQQHHGHGGALLPRQQ
ncbi:hypothetical protein AW27_029975 [Streptomyces sp. PCS3-D2]|uniref:hypothetical protein n=1 Tax=Streptomyces sp. PCS3-D2 TaxID=1460244 RepID=UPI000445CFC9|nr:hypothetical protein [Streptomyces sp. PCS3-D2]WKV75382.1 hypothetical protein AW27_029975 [Streptomyces sp. PCS3-D2]